MEWIINQMDCYPTVDGDVDVVFTVHYGCKAEEIVEDKTYTGYVYGTVGVTHDAEEPFVPYAELTKEQVIGWVKEALGEEAVAAAEAAVLQQIEDQKNPKVISPALPW